MLFCDQPGLHQPLAYVKHVAPIIGGFYIDRDFLSQELEHDKGFPYKVFKKCLNHDMVCHLAQEHFLKYLINTRYPRRSK